MRIRVDVQLQRLLCGGVIIAAGQGKRIPDSKKAAVMAALLEGQAVTKVADDYKIDKATVSRIKKQLPADKLQEVATKKELDIANSIALMLDASFKAIHNILRQTENAEWLNKQPADELATFIGVTSDKVFRVLEAIENAQTQSDEWPEEVSAVR
jgi:transposase-like protein